VPPTAPILFGFTLHCWCRRVLDLEPIGDSAGSIKRAQPFRHDAFTALAAHRERYR
jgi:hypothetical protein